MLSFAVSALVLQLHSRSTVLRKNCSSIRLDLCRFLQRSIQNFPPPKHMMYVWKLVFHGIRRLIELALLYIGKHQDHQPIW